MVKLARDNRWGYGLAGGGGIAFLIRRFELNFRVRYSFGYSDIVRNRNKYYDNNSDGAENPFWATPLRSPLSVFPLRLVVFRKTRNAKFVILKCFKVKRCNII